MKKHFGVVHGVAICDDCGWHTESYKNAQANAARHAKAHKHVVQVDLGIAGEYNGKE